MASQDDHVVVLLDDDDDDDDDNDDTKSTLVEEAPQQPIQQEGTKADEAAQMSTQSNLLTDFSTEDLDSVVAEVAPKEPTSVPQDDPDLPAVLDLSAQVCLCTCVGGSE